MAAADEFQPIDFQHLRSQHGQVVRAHGLIWRSVRMHQCRPRRSDRPVVASRSTTVRACGVPLASTVANTDQFECQGDHHTPPAYVEQAFRKYLACGIFAPFCHTRRMVEAAAHLCDHMALSANLFSTSV